MKINIAEVTKLFSDITVMQ